MGQDATGLLQRKPRLGLGHEGPELHRGNPFIPDSSYFTFGIVASVGINAEGT
jgi:hypothetical protein